eukprot:CAMPEP_0118930360 /NCGR_PEP_ID=MMETSP1169-20130426/7076_1 /TAXON_ID=36882 /ORGANISM="Pyramimonas obovata, Strain CCMP722" /LENGTH=275 /DNA_ID=CAMNT_0006872705 /DNA_START=102 /DNA_END=929 /DNA_ORIENTATION=+
MAACFLVGKTVAKNFDGTSFKGTVTAFDKKDLAFPFQVKYEDDDQEDLSCEELKSILADELSDEEKKELLELEEKIKEHEEKLKKAEEEKRQKEEERKQKALEKAHEREEREKAAEEKAAEARPKRGRPPKDSKSKEASVTATGVASKKPKTEAIGDKSIVRYPPDGERKYSTCVQYGGVLYVAGQVANDTSDTTVKGQTRQVLNQVDAILRTAGSSKQQILKVTFYLADMSKYDEYNHAWSEWVDMENLPVRATVEGKCVKPEFLVEAVVEAAA